MRRYLVILAGLLSLFSPAAQAANSTVSAMTAASAFGGTELLYIVQGAADRKGTPAQMATYVYGLASGDCTISSAGAVVCTKTNGVAFGALATATPGTGVTTAIGNALNGTGGLVGFSGALGTPTSATLTNATGLPIGGLTGLGSGVGAFLGTPSSTNLAAAVTGETGSGALVFGTAPTISSPTINTAATLGFITGSTQCLHVDTSGALSGTGSDCGAGGGSGTVTSVAAGCGISTGGSAITTTGTVSANVSARNNTSTSDTIASTDCGSLVTESNASAVAVGIPVATTSGFGTGFYATVKNKGAGLVTISPTTSTIDGAASLTLSQQQSVDIVSDGANYYTLPGRPYLPCAGLTGGTTCGTPIGTVIGTISTQSGTTYTFAATDCGTTVRFSNASAITATIPATLTTNCLIAIEQAGAGKVSVNGSAVTPATLHSAHSYTGTAAQWSIVDVLMESSGVAVLTGDGS